MSWCARQWRPIGIAHESGIAAAGADGGHGPPETERKFSVPAADGGVGESGPQHGHQSRAIRSVELHLRRESPEGAAVLLAGMLRPEKANLCLLRSANCAVARSERHYLVVVVNPLLAIHCIGTFIGEKLGRAHHGEGCHLPEPRRYRRREGRRSPLVKPRPDWRSIWNINQQAAPHSRVDQGLTRRLSPCPTRGNIRGRVSHRP